MCNRSRPGSSGFLIGLNNSAVRVAYIQRSSSKPTTRCMKERGEGEVNEKVTGFGIFGWRTECRKKNLFAEPFGCSGGGSLCRRTRSEEEGNNEGV